MGKPRQTTRQILRLRLHAQPGTAIPVGALVRVRIEGDAPADALAPLLTERLLRVPPQGRALLALECPLDLPSDTIEQSYVRIHVDRDEDGRVTVGDQVSFQVHHLGAAASDEGLDVPLQLVADSRSG